MNDLLEFSGPPGDWVPHGGRYARVLDAHNGIPAYESDTGKLLIYETIAISHTQKANALPDGTRVFTDSVLLIPYCYTAVAIRSVLAGDHELSSLHDDPDALWVWRPLLYRLTNAGLQRFGSQQELSWRWGLVEAIERKEDLQALTVELVQGARDSITAIDKIPDDYTEMAKARYAELSARPWRHFEANTRARAILLEHLAPLQRLELEGHGHFHVRGQVNQLYRVEPGNGAAIVNPLTHQTIVSLCLHPERWLPDDDVALATKMLIDSGRDGELEMIEGARLHWYGHYRPSTANERAAYEREMWLLPEPTDR